MCGVTTWTKPSSREGGAQGVLELDQWRRALVGAQRLQAGAPFTGELVLGLLEGRVALGRVREGTLDLLGVGAELPEALGLGGRQPDGAARGHRPGSCRGLSQGRRAR